MDNMPRSLAWENAKYLLILPFLLVLAWAGAIPYRIYRLHFDRPAWVNLMIGVINVGFIAACSLLGSKEPLKLHTSSPPIVLTWWLATITLASYLLWGLAYASITICITLLCWVASISFKRGVIHATRSQIGTEADNNLDDLVGWAGPALLPIKLPVALLCLCAACLIGWFGGGFYLALFCVSLIIAPVISFVAFLAGALALALFLGPHFNETGQN
jgi:hypothetical protein